ncbi:Hsp20/alpha crystallin family protein [Aromatoleum evansii]|uniref:Hsp20/alpha crystallin family protein n=1 Tax=Aromatoleum evansii TaxID=59406 RepID=A0ABZ1ASJ7_AROEV|nr:Spore protein SP21 [Azoarcus sp. Aa7]WRL48803.1 Hsp20/alpha crystallin family protein [Aromatoleum evansii]
METTSEVARTQDAGTSAVQVKTGEEVRTLMPLVDIFEDSEGITVEADLPGVAKDRLNVQADRHRLTIEGDVVIDMPEGMEALYADVQATRYARSFALSGELDAERTEASLKDGVLTVHIPKRSEFRPRKIEVRVS